MPPPTTPASTALDDDYLETLGIKEWAEYGWDVGGKFLNKPGARPNLNAYLAHWRQQFGPQNMSQQDARAVYDLQFAYLEDEGLMESDYDDYADVVSAIESLGLTPLEDIELPT